jgi:hypothetical protein
MNKNIKIVIVVAVLAVLGVGAWWLLSGSGVKSFHKENLTRVPQSAGVAVSVDVEWFLDQLIEQNLGLLPESGNASEIKEKMGVESKKYFGVDIMAAEKGIAWYDPGKGAMAIWLKGDFGSTLKGQQSKYEGVSLTQLEYVGFAALVDDGLLIGNEEGVKQGIRVFKDKEKSIADKESILEAHNSVLSDVDDGMIILSATAHGLPVPSEFSDKVKGTAMSISEDGGIHAVINGDSDVLKMLKSAFEMGSAQAGQAVDGMIDQAKTKGNGAAVVMLTLVKAKLKEVLEIVKVEHDGDKLTLKVENAGALLSLSALGGVVAVPAFIKYMRRAKTTEAIDSLDKIYKASSTYYTSPRVEARTGRKIDCQFPVNQGMTPDITRKRCCGGPLDMDKDDRCDVDTSQWTTPTWSALNFQMNDQHYFGYAYQATGFLAGARFTASAYADLDCDGKLSTFQRSGYGDETASRADCSMKGSSAFYKNNETE